MNSACAEVLPGAKHSYGAKAPPCRARPRSCPASILYGQDKRKGCLSFCKGWLKSTLFRNKAKRHKAAAPNRSPATAGSVWKGGARERADDIFFAAGIKRRRSKANFAPTCKGRLKSIFYISFRQSKICCHGLCQTSDLQLWQIRHNEAISTA